MISSLACCSGLEEDEIEDQPEVEASAQGSRTGFLFLAPVPSAVFLVLIWGYARNLWRHRREMPGVTTICLKVLMVLVPYPHQSVFRGILL